MQILGSLRHCVGEATLLKEGRETASELLKVAREPLKTPNAGLLLKNISSSSTFSLVFRSEKAVCPPFLARFLKAKGFTEELKTTAELARRFIQCVHARARKLGGLRRC